MTRAAATPSRPTSLVVGRQPGQLPRSPCGRCLRCPRARSGPASLVPVDGRRRSIRSPDLSRPVACRPRLATGNTRHGVQCDTAGDPAPAGLLACSLRRAVRGRARGNNIPGSASPSASKILFGEPIRRIPGDSSAALLAHAELDPWTQPARNKKRAIGSRQSPARCWPRVFANSDPGRLVRASPLARGSAQPSAPAEGVPPPPAREISARPGQVPRSPCCRGTDVPYHLNRSATTSPLVLSHQ